MDNDLISFIGINQTHIYCLFEILPDYKKFSWSGEGVFLRKYSTQYAVIFGPLTKKLNIQIRTCNRSGFVDESLLDLINGKKSEYSGTTMDNLELTYPSVHKQVINYLTIAKLTCQ